MATLVEARLASGTARDGVDTRLEGEKDLTVACNEKQERDGQTAALYSMPPGAEVVGSPMHAYWSNYRRLADAYVNGEDCFIWVSYKTQQSYNEKDIERLINRTDEILHMYRMFYNSAITEFRKSLDSRDLEDALEYMADFNKEQIELQTAAKTIQTWFRSFPKISETGTYIAEEEEHGECYKCGDRSMFETGLCADCYWSEDAHIKNLRRRAMRQNAIPSGDN